MPDNVPDAIADPEEVTMDRNATPTLNEFFTLFVYLAFKADAPDTQTSLTELTG